MTDSTTDQPRERIDRAQMGPTPHIPIVTLIGLLIGLQVLAEVAPGYAAALARYAESAVTGLTVVLAVVAIVGFIVLNVRREVGDE